MTTQRQRLIVALLRAKRELQQTDLALVEELNDLQRELEAEEEEYGVVLASEYKTTSMEGTPRHPAERAYDEVCDEFPYDEKFSWVEQAAREMRDRWMAVTE